MHRIAHTIALAIAVPPALPASGEAQVVPVEAVRSLEDWYARAQRAAPGQWGIAILTGDGRLVWAANPNEPLVAASTTKIFTTGYARSVLGGDARISTRVVGAGYVDTDGRWRGPWALELNGDFTLDRAAGSGPSLRRLAAQLHAMGIRELRGPLVLRSTTGSTATAIPVAWEDRYPGQLYAPPVGAVSLHENVMSVTVRPGSRVGAAPEVMWSVPAGWEALVRIEARTVEGSRSRLRLEPFPDGTWALTGSIGQWARPAGFASIPARPDLVLEHAWAAALDRHGIRWERTMTAPALGGERMAPLAQVTSAPLDTLASEVNRRSLNVGAEALLRWAAGSGGADRVSAHVREVVGPTARIHLADGSGLSPRGRVAPLTQALYLVRAPRSASRTPLPLLLPRNGTGTLRGLGRGALPHGAMRAKTGTLDNVAALAGYLGRRDGVLVVSAIYNGSRIRAARRAQWELFRLLGADGVDVAAATSRTHLGGDDIDRR
jgi:D-alanyl-D-alanine carboxypeptidase/D-alanyl-D-alanine-endopeptidase (penicillin-binding protein 4)